MDPNNDFIKSALQVNEDLLPELNKIFDEILKKDPDQIPALFGCHLISMRTGDINSAVSYIREIFTRIPYHSSYIALYLQNFESFEKLLETTTVYIEKFPKDPFGYIMEILAYYSAGDMENVRNGSRKLFRTAKMGFHFQPSTIASIFDATRGDHKISLESESVVKFFMEEFSKFTSVSDKNSFIPVDTTREETQCKEKLNIVTSCGESIGLKRAVINGQISGASKPTSYFFRFGAGPEEMDRKTETRQVPPGYFGRVRDTGDNIYRRITAFSLTSSFIETGDQENVGSVAMKLEGPFGKDRNHREGIGVIDLLSGWQSAAHLRGKVPPTFETETYPKPTYPGEAIDIRDAKFTIIYRAKGLDSKEFFPVAWVHGGSGEALLPNLSENYAAWAYTGNLGKWEFVDDGKWRNASFNLECTSTAWSFCGSNVEETEASMERICYHPIGSALRENRSGNICLCFVCGDETRPPEGDIEIGALELLYRSYSLLAPSQDAPLCSSPDNGETNPSLLTNGWIGSLENSWKSIESPTEAQEFVWRFRDDASIQSVRLHQNPLWPSNGIELFMSQDGEQFEEVWSGSLDNVPTDPSDWPSSGQSGVPFNFATIAVFDTPVHGQFLKLKITSGHQQKYWGLDAIEVFGNAPVFIPSPDLCTVSEEISELEPGAQHFQLVVENENGLVEGEIIKLVRPTSSVPLVSNPVVISRSSNTAVIQFRTNAMGAWSKLTGTVGGNGSDKIKSIPVLTGKQEAARESVLRFEGLEAATAIEGIATATNEYGTSEPCRFTIPAERNVV
jgi:hypothetical protein